MRRNNTEQKLWKLFVKNKNNGFVVLAFTLYFFIENLYKKADEAVFGDIFFLSREGQFLKELFDEYQASHFESCKIKSHYLIVSRRSTAMPAFKSLENEDFDIIFRQYSDISIYDFLSSIGLKEKDIRKIGENLRLDIYERYEDFKHQYIYRKLRKCELFKSLYEEKRIEQKSNFQKYLDSFGVDYSKEFCIVDVGWKGTIQDNIFEFLNEEVKITGLYLGINDHGIIDPLNIKDGIIFYTDSKRNTSYSFVFGDSTSIYEVMLSASHGSAYSYENKNGIIIPICKEEEKEMELYHNIVKPEQCKMMALFKEIDNICKHSQIAPTEEFWADIHARFTFTPTKGQILTFSKMYHYENFGIFEYSSFGNKKITLKSRLSALMMFARQPRKFLSSGYWIPVTLYSNGLKCLCRLWGLIAYKRFYKDKSKKIRKA